MKALSPAAAVAAMQRQGRTHAGLWFRIIAKRTDRLTLFTPRAGRYVKIAAHHPLWASHKVATWSVPVEMTQQSAWACHGYCGVCLIHASRNPAMIMQSNAAIRTNERRQSAIHACAM